MIDKEEIRKRYLSISDNLNTFNPFECNEAIDKLIDIIEELLQEIKD